MNFTFLHQKIPLPILAFNIASAVRVVGPPRPSPPSPLSWFDAVCCYLFVCGHCISSLRVRSAYIHIINLSSPCLSCQPQSIYPSIFLFPALCCSSCTNSRNQTQCQKMTCTNEKRFFQPIVDFRYVPRFLSGRIKPFRVLVIIAASRNHTSVPFSQHSVLVPKLDGHCPFLFLDVPKASIIGRSARLKTWQPNAMERPQLNSF